MFRCLQACGSPWCFWCEIPPSCLPVPDLGLLAHLWNKDLTTNQPIGFHERQVARWVADQMVHLGHFQGLGLQLLLTLVFWEPKSLLYEPPFLPDTQLPFCHPRGWATLSSHHTACCLPVSLPAGHPISQMLIAWYTAWHREGDSSVCCNNRRLQNGVLPPLFCRRGDAMS